MRLQPVHRAKRFFAAIVPARVGADDQAWVAGVLSERELAAFERMDVRDRAHSIRVGRAVDAHLDSTGSHVEDRRWILAAALLHDVGKSGVRLGTYGRVVATLAGWIAGEDMAPIWAQKQGLTRRIGLYLQHPVIGADILRMAGSDDRVIAWALEHYESPQGWSIAADVGRILQAADDGRLDRI